MVTLWNIAIGKMNPDGTPKGEAPEIIVPSEEDKVLEEDARATPVHQAQTGNIEDPDTKEHFDYKNVDDKQVLVSKRTKYRIWKAFENGTHSTLRYVPSRSSANRCTDDTCVQPGYWAAVWEFVNSLAPL
jgi:hypothetical protein